MSRGGPIVKGKGWVQGLDSDILVLLVATWVNLPSGGSAMSCLPGCKPSCRLARLLFERETALLSKAVEKKDPCLKGVFQQGFSYLD